MENIIIIIPKIIEIRVNFFDSRKKALIKYKIGEKINKIKDKIIRCLNMVNKLWLYFSIDVGFKSSTLNKD